MRFQEAKYKIVQYYINGLDSNEMPVPIDYFYADVAEIDCYDQLIDFLWNHLGSSKAVHKLIFNALSS